MYGALEESSLWWDCYILSAARADAGRGAIPRRRSEGRCALRVRVLSNANLTPSRLCDRVRRMRDPDDEKD